MRLLVEYLCVLSFLCSLEFVIKYQSKKIIFLFSSASFFKELTRTRKLWTKQIKRLKKFDMNEFGDGLVGSIGTYVRLSF